MIVGCSKPINEETLIDKGGLKYHPETKELYSGKVFQNRMGGKKDFEGSYKDGKKDGKWTKWYKNGQKYEIRNWKSGIEHGKITLWYENGQKRHEETIKNGVYDGGKITRWYENGQKQLETFNMNGQGDGYHFEWDKYGRKIVDDIYLNGNVVKSKIDD